MHTELTPEQWEHVKDLFCRALDHEASERAVFLSQACGSESAVRAEVSRLLGELESLSQDVPTVRDLMARPVFEPAVSSSKSEYLWRHLNHYRILERLGSGGMADVYRAHDEKLRRDVAIKVLADISGRAREQIGQFQHEAQLLASLSHPHIASIHGFEEEEGTYFLVLELVEGETLAERISRGPLPVAEALDIGGQIAEALEEAHAKKIVHLDLKPANIKITPNRVVKVLDFGIAKIFAREDAPGGKTPPRETHTIAGTLPYMSPEQARGDAVDWRTDIWAWGCVMYEMLTGQRPFEGDHSSGLLSRIATSEPEWTRLRAPASIHALLKRCLQKDAGRRLQHIAQARTEIERELRRRKPPGPSRRYRVVAVITAALAALIAALFLLSYLGSH